VDRCDVGGFDVSLQSLVRSRGQGGGEDPVCMCKNHGGKEPFRKFVTFTAISSAQDGQLLDAGHVARTQWKH
jgi:hypothetical protein